MGEILADINAFFASAMVGSVLDLLIFVVACVPAVYISAKFLFGDSTNARRLLGSPRLMGWLFFFCGFEILLHMMKVPVLVKVLVIILGVVVLPIVLFYEVVID